MQTEETALKSAVKDVLLIKGIFSYPIQQSLGSYPGLPDRVMHRNGRVEYLEIKKPKGKQSPAQFAFQEQCEADGIPYHVVRTVDDIIRIVEERIKK